MKRFKVKGRHVILTVTIICIGLIVWTTYRPGDTIIHRTVGTVVMPVQKGLNFISNSVSKSFTWVKNLGSLQEDNKLLLEKVETLTQENQKLQLEHKELQRLREMFELTETYDSYSTTGARIVSKAPGNWYDSFIIDKGKKEGLDKGMVVLASGGLVGHISDVSEHYAVVRSIIDDTSSVHGKVIRTNDFLFVEGDKLLAERGLCSLTFISKEAEIIKGDDVVTSNLGDIYPPGIRIGRVTEVEESNDGLSKTAYLEPFVDFRNLNEVVVITEKYKEAFKQEVKELEFNK